MTRRCFYFFHVNIVYASFELRGGEIGGAAGGDAHWSGGSHQGEKRPTERGAVIMTLNH